MIQRFVRISPYRNETNCMHQTLGNLIAQGFDPTERASVADASADAILKIVARYSRKHRRIDNVKRVDQDPLVFDCLAVPRKRRGNALHVKARRSELSFKEILSLLPTPRFGIWRSSRCPRNEVV